MFFTNQTQSFNLVTVFPSSVHQFFWAFLLLFYRRVYVFLAIATFAFIFVLFCRETVISVSYSRLPQLFDHNTKQDTLPCSRVSCINKENISLQSFLSLSPSLVFYLRVTMFFSDAVFQWRLSALFSHELLAFIFVSRHFRSHHTNKACLFLKRLPAKKLNLVIVNLFPLWKKYISCENIANSVIK